MNSSKEDNKTTLHSCEENTQLVKEHGISLSKQVGLLTQEVRLLSHKVESQSKLLQLMAKQVCLNSKKFEPLLKLTSLLEEDHKTLSVGEALVVTLTGYASKRENSTIFYSNPFYTHPGGYKMCVRVDANGYGNSTDNVSVFTNIQEGRHDDNLHWPFEGTVQYELLNQLFDDNHYSKIVKFEAAHDCNVGDCLGYKHFISQSALSHDPIKRTQYLKNDTLYLRVSVTENTHPWLRGK